VERHTAVYLRVSSRSQDTASQEPDLKRWVEAYADGEPVVMYRDKFTGKTMDRPGWNKLEAALNAVKVSRVVVWRLDRLGRTAKGLTALFDELVNRKVNLVSLREGLDLSTPAGRLMCVVLAGVAAYETEVRAERILAGQEAARAKGKTWGGGIKGKRIKVEPEQEETIRGLKAQGWKVAAIARATGLTRPTVYSVIRAKAAPGL
jgi:DNA invertase Pin-like site-specific DNA recombinase